MPKMSNSILVVTCLAVAALSIQSTQAAEKPIPTTPSAPPLLTTRVPEDNFHCKRIFIYQGKALECDSSVQMDGERLRPILERSPAAIHELNTYQQNRRTLRKTAYVSSAGLILALGAYLFNAPKEASDKVLPISILMWSGLAVSAGTITYAIALKNTNDAHLGKAVDIYNRENPDRPIELQFSTGFNF
jgi:hypothetical protein